MFTRRQHQTVRQLHPVGLGSTDVRSAGSQREPGHLARSSCLQLAIAALAVSALSATADPQATVPKAVSFQKPLWLKDLALGVKESYDDNVFVSGTGPSKNRESWVTTVSPKVGFDFATFIGDQQQLSVLSLGYAPDFNVYHDETSESYNAHRIATAVKGKAGAFSYALENGFNYVDGSENGPIYLAGRSAYGSAVPRERREQFQDRAKIVLQYDLGDWFIRPTASLLYYDLRTKMRPGVGIWKGYDNYPDRHDVNGGMDVGYKASPTLTVTLGYRYGHQHQEQFSAPIDPLYLSAPSDYQRILVGVEAKPWKWLTLSALAGPDFRSYEPNGPTHVTPIKDPHLVTYYAEASLVAEITTQDLVSFKYKQWQWVSSIGKLPYFDSLYDLSYRHKFGQRFSVELGGRLQGSDYTSGDAATSVRNDCQYTLSAGMNYAFTANLSATAAYNLDLGRNLQDGLTEAIEEQREFDRQIFSLGLTFKF